MQAQQAETRVLRTARQVTSRENFTAAVEEAFNPFGADKEIEFKALEKRPPEVPSEEERKDEAQKVHEKQDFDSYAEQRQEQNPELNAQRLRELRNLMIAKGAGTSAEEALGDARSFFNDVSLADEALQIVQETVDAETAEMVQKARELLDAQQGRDVRAGRNMGAESRAWAERGLGAAADLRDYYRDIVGNPREGNALFDEMTGKWDFDQLKEVIKFLFESLGADLRSKGPSIARGELYTLVTETRVLQSILGVFNFFQKRERQARKRFAKEKLPWPEDLDFEEMAEQFMQLVEEKYPTSGKVVRAGRELGIGEDLVAQVIVFEQFRDAIRQVAPRLYRNLQHRYDVLLALIEALEELEDELAEEEGDV
jgi:type III secretion protein W